MRSYGDAVDLGHDAARGQQRVAPQLHGRGARVRLHALHGHVVPALAQRGLHHAYHALMLLQHRALLDVRLEVRAHGVRGAAFARVADGCERLAHAHTLRVALRQRVLQREGAGEHARAHHHGHEARALFVRPHGHFDGRARVDARGVERAHHLQAREHAVVAVELAARGLGVDMAAGHHRRQAVVGAGAAREDVADGVHADAAAGLACPLHEQVAALAVELGERDAAHAALGRAADARQIHERLPQARAVDAQRGDG
ncbi:ribonuclease E [Alicycliphilus sp. B1]|nr:ribonuclease E [Alicycliphilus sp. B1]